MNTNSASSSLVRQPAVGPPAAGRCRLCEKPVVLSPSPTVRAARYGGSPGDYSRLFTGHNACLIAERSNEAKSLMAERVAEEAALGTAYAFTHIRNPLLFTSMPQRTIA